MHTLLHYYYTLKLYGFWDALVAYAADIDPAKTYLHSTLYMGETPGLAEKILGLPRSHWRGVIAHVVQDAYWQVFIRRLYQDRRTIRWHRFVEVMWTRQWARERMPEPPRIEIDDLLEILRYYGPVDREAVERIHGRIIDSIYAPIEWVRSTFPEYVGVDIRGVLEDIWRAFDEAELLQLTLMLSR